MRERSETKFSEASFLSGRVCFSRCFLFPALGKNDPRQEGRFPSFPIPVLLNCCTNASTKGSPLILRAGTQSDPNIYSIPTSIMINQFGLPPEEGAGCSIKCSVIYFTPCAISSLPHVRTELAHCW